MDFITLMDVSIFLIRHRCPKEVVVCIEDYLSLRMLLNVPDVKLSDDYVTILGTRFTTNRSDEPLDISHTKMLQEVMTLTT